METMLSCPSLSLLSPPIIPFPAGGENESEGVTRLLLENLGSMTRFFPFIDPSPAQPFSSFFLLFHRPIWKSRKGINVWPVKEEIERRYLPRPLRTGIRKKKAGPWKGKKTMRLAPSNRHAIPKWGANRSLSLLHLVFPFLAAACRLFPDLLWLPYEKCKPLCESAQEESKNHARALK